MKKFKSISFGQCTQLDRWVHYPKEKQHKISDFYTVSSPSSSCKTCLKMEEDDRLTLNMGKFDAVFVELVLNSKGLALALLSPPVLLLRLAEVEKFGLTKPKVGMAEVGVDLPLEGVPGDLMLLKKEILVTNRLVVL